MTEPTQIVSKVLVHECNDDALTALKNVCTEHKLVGLKVSTGNNNIGLKDASNEIDDVLKSNVDLGAIFLTEESDPNGFKGTDLCLKIHHTRPELPIFLRRIEKSDGSDLDQDVQDAITGYYTLNNTGELDDLIKKYVCSMYYPVELAQGIQEISFDAFSNIIKDSAVHCDQPYLVKDQIIYGELFSLIPLESEWCRGYMMLQTTENEILELIRSGRTYISSTRPDSRDTNAVLNEITNMIWGGIKSRYFQSGESPDEAHRTQVPIIVNHLQKHISFGSTEPQLCFKYTINNLDKKYPGVTIYQRLVFNLSWSPEKFAESDKTVDDFVDNGELELF
tara:strand:+ start:24784 stop:25791 length:1008 start_codon:yes stop_codon:yes gene_type:complete